MLVNEEFAKILNAAHQRVENGQYAQALSLLESALEIKPRDLVALRAASALAWELRMLDLAAQYSFRACVEDMNGENFAILMEVSRFVSHYKTARDYMRQLAALYPQDTRVLTGLSALYERAGYRTQAAQYMLRAFNISGTILHYNQYAKLFSFWDAQYLRDVLANAKPNAGSVEEEFAFSMEMAIRSEHAERASRGLGAMAMSADDLFFRFAVFERDAVEQLADQLLARGDKVEFAYLAKAMCLLGRGNVEAAHEIFQRLAEKKPHMLYANIVFDPVFLEQLATCDESASLSTLPPVKMLRAAAFTDAPVIFLSCDFDFFQNFCRPMLASINRYSPSAQVHLHIFNIPAGEEASVLYFVDRCLDLKVALSSEVTAMATREYFHAIRFVRLYQFIIDYQRPMFVMDVDALLHRDILPILNSVQTADISLMAHAGYWAPWNQFRAGIVGIRPTPRGLNYLRLVALYILTFYRKDMLRWGVDQIALYVVHTLLSMTQREPKIHFFDDSVMADNCDENAVIWCKSGNAKFELPSEIEGESALMDSPRLRYMKALEDLGFVYAD